MRIAVITNAYPPRVSGGAARIASIYSEELIALGHEVRVWKATEMFDRLDTTHPLRRLFFHLRDLGARSQTVEEVLAWKPDALLTHTLTGCGHATPKAIQKKGIRWAHILHDVQLIDPSGQVMFGEGHSLLRVSWRWCWSSLRKRAFGNPDAVVSPTEWLLNFHQTWGWFKGAQVRVIPNPIHLTLPSPSLGEGSAGRSLRTSSPSEGEEAGGEVGRGSGRVRSIVFVGRLDPDKGLLILLDAWKRLADATACLVIIGKGSLAHFVTSQSASRIDYPGEQPSSVVLQKMRESRVVVVPSLVMENQSTVILEGLSAGCRVVASDVGGNRETLGGAGTIVAPGDVEALAIALHQALDDQKDHSMEIEKTLSLHEPLKCTQRLVELLKSNL